MKMKMMFMGDSADYKAFYDLQASISFDIIYATDSKYKAKDNRVNCYKLMRDVLSCDWIVIDAKDGLSYLDGAIMMLAKLYKIPIYIYNISFLSNSNDMFFKDITTKSFYDVNQVVSYINEIYRNNRLQMIHDRLNPEDIILKFDAFDAGYDTGYFEVERFWGCRPANYVQMAAEFYKGKRDVRCIDLGCGTGKNAIYLSSYGFEVEAIDSSYYAIIQAKALSSNVDWKVGDVRKWNPSDRYDIIVMTGLLHCYSTSEEIIETVNISKASTKKGGYNVLSVFNDELQDLSGHPSDFNPVLLPNQFYINLYNDWSIIACSNTILDDEHPNNNIKHRHSITRLLVRNEK